MERHWEFSGLESSLGRKYVGSSSQQTLIMDWDHHVAEFWSFVCIEDKMSANAIRL